MTTEEVQTWVFCGAFIDFDDELLVDWFEETQSTCEREGTGGLLGIGAVTRVPLQRPTPESEFCWGGSRSVELCSESSRFRFVIILGVGPGCWGTNFD